MRLSWNNLYEKAKDRRYGMLFLLAPLVLFFLLGSLVTLIWRGIFWRRERLKFPPLSSDELAKARSKLVKNRSQRIL